MGTSTAPGIRELPALAVFDPLVDIQKTMENHRKSPFVHGKITISKMNDWLMVEPYPSEKWWSQSVGMMTFPIYGKMKNVPNHPPNELIWAKTLIGKIRKCIDTIDIPFGNQTWRRLQNPLMIFSLKPPFSWEGGWMLCGTSVSKAECWLRDWAIAATPRQLKWVWQWPLKMHSTTDMALSYSWLRHIHKYRLMFTLYSKESHPYHSKNFS